MSKCTLLATTLAAASLLCTGSASAAPYSVSGYADGSASSCSLSYGSCGVNYYYNYTTINPSVNFGNVDTSGSTPSPATSNVYETGTGSATPYATSTSWTKGSVGIAHGYASVKVTGAVAGTDGTEARARAYSSWTDQLTVTAPLSHLAVGTPVTLLATLVNEGTVAAGGAASTYQYWNPDGALGAGGGASFTASDGGPISWGLTCDNTAPGFSLDGNKCVKSIEIATTVGATLNLSGDLDLRVYADFSAGDTVVADATADYANTSYVTFTPESAGISLTTASGYAYVAPVPLPASLWLMLSGLTGVGVVASRRKARHAAA